MCIKIDVLYTIIRVVMVRSTELEFWQKIFETETLTLRGRDFYQKVWTRPRLERAETETKHETFETTHLQNVANIFDSKLWAFRWISEHVAMYQAMSYLMWNKQFNERQVQA